MKKVIIVLIATASFISCNKIEEGTPECIENSIKTFSKEQACKDGAKVDKYKFQEKEVYVFEPGNCGADMTSEVKDNKCNILGCLGGIAGNIKINNEEFSNAKFISTVWEN